MIKLYEILSGLKKEECYDYVLVKNSSLILFEWDYRDYMEAGYEKATYIKTFFGVSYIFVRRLKDYIARCTATLEWNNDLPELPHLMAANHNQSFNSIKAITREGNTLKFYFNRPVKGQLELFLEK